MRTRTVLFLITSLVVLAVACAPTDEPGPDGSFLTEGDHAPDFTLPSAMGDRVSLEDFTNRKPILLYFSMGPG